MNSSSSTSIPDPYLVQLQAMAKHLETVLACLIETKLNPKMLDELISLYQTLVQRQQEKISLYDNPSTYHRGD